MKIHPGEWSPTLAREIYDALGPLTQTDVYRVRTMCESSRRRYFANVYGWHASRLAQEDYRRMTR